MRKVGSKVYRSGASLLGTPLFNKKVAVYGKVEKINEFAEKTYSYGHISDVWASISVTRAGQRSAEGDTVYSEITHKFILRGKSIPNLSIDTYFVFDEQRYDVVYFYPNYSYADRIEIFCSLVVE